MQKKKVQNDNYIVNIPISKTINDMSTEQFNLEDNFYKYNPKLSDPTPFNSSESNYFNINDNDNNNTASNVIMNDNTIIKKINDKYDIDYQGVFENCSEFKNGIPKNTNIHCFWCTHKFEGMPCVLPISHEASKFKVIGCFCSPECASAYNFKNFPNNCWENNSLLNLLYKITYKNVNVKIKPAPNRELLNIFGGRMTINQFRSSLNYNKTHILAYPPLNCILSNHETNYKQTQESELKIKRSIPLKSRNTLDRFVITS